MIYTEKISRAIKFAAKTHNDFQNQLRKGKNIPYITHPLSVGLILSLAGAGENVIIAGILHDTIEDSIKEHKVTPEILADKFNENVSRLVMDVTEKDKTLPWEERKRLAVEHIASFSNDSLLVKSADVISNNIELLDDYRKIKDEVFKRFKKITKEQYLDNQLKVTSAILNKWDKNPLAEDLTKIAVELENIKNNVI